MGRISIGFRLRRYPFQPYLSPERIKTPGQRSLSGLKWPQQITPSRITGGLFRVSNFPVFSSITFRTCFRTLYFLPQYRSRRNKSPCFSIPSALPGFPLYFSLRQSLRVADSIFPGGPGFRHQSGIHEGIQSSSADGIAGFVRTLVNLESPPAIREHLRHERQVFQAPAVVQGRKNFLPIPDFHPFPGAKVQGKIMFFIPQEFSCRRCLSLRLPFPMNIFSKHNLVYMRCVFPDYCTNHSERT